VPQVRERDLIKIRRKGSVTGAFVSIASNPPLLIKERGRNEREGAKPPLLYLFPFEGD